MTTTAAKTPAVSVGSAVGPAATQTLEEVVALTRRLRMPYLRKAAVDVVPTARAQRWDPAELLRVLLSEEITGRDQATLRLRRARANFPAGKTFAVWDETRCSIPAPTQHALRTLEWVHRRENLCVCGSLRGWLTLRISPISCVEQSSLVGFDLDTQAFAASAVDVDGLQFAALDLVQHGLSGDAEGFGGLVEAEPALG